MKKRPPGRGSIEKRGDKHRARLPRDESGKRPILYMPDGTSLFDTYEAAEEALDGVLALLDEGTAVTPSSLTLAAYGDRVMRRRARHGSELRAEVKGTRQEQSAWSTHVRSAPFAEESIDCVTRGAIKAWLRAKLAEPAFRGGAPGARKPTGKTLSEKTVANALGVLRIVLTAAVEEGLIDRNVAEGVKVPKTTQETDKSTYLYPPELAKVFALDLAGHVRAGLGLALYTGLRRSSLLALEWSDVDLDAGVLTSRKQKRGRFFRQHLLPEAVKLLRWWKERAPRGRWVFTAPVGKGELPRPYSKDYDFGFPDLRAAAGITRIDPAPCLHSFRHTCAVALLGGWWGPAWSVAAVRDHLSHASVTITEKYLHFVDEAAAQRAAATAGGLAVIPSLPEAPEVVPSASAVVPSVVPGPSEPAPATQREDSRKGAVSSVVEQRAFNRLEPEQSREPTAEPVAPGDHAPAAGLRARMVAFLSAAVAEGTASGDLEAARVANEAIGRLLGSAVPVEGAKVVDLATRRRGES